MKKGLFLCGVQCTADIWDEIRDALSGYDLDFVTYPHEVTQSARSVSDITKWVYDIYGNKRFDFLVGHSMGGIAALELASRYKISCDAVVFIESNLRPAGNFYRNLMMPDHMQKFGDRIKSMLQSEAPFYRDDLKHSLQEGFDFTPFLYGFTGAIYGVYGDRGVQNYSGRITDLCLSKADEEKVSFRFVANSCHMPMLENPTGLADVIRRCIHEALAEKPDRTVE